MFCFVNLHAWFKGTEQKKCVVDLVISENVNRRYRELEIEFNMHIQGKLLQHVCHGRMF